ncbi:hypothetical protein MTR67_012280 [Solanum verrucosum]|uniref:Uncharacterized protein n=1 Tax=Solanum verrucosum TaxID=315347 RepID=A0AAF0TMS8_SOLVR|nr:hypothetical protein MTR67_012280 [Solanum verrucosum]
MDMVVLGSNKGSPIKVPLMLQYQGSSKIRCLTINLKKGIVVDLLLSTCNRYGRKHDVKCLVTSYSCFDCGNTYQNIIDFPLVVKNEGDNHRRPQPYPFISF